MGELEMELALLREENARLKIERHRAPDSGRVIERMRHLSGEPDDAGHSGNGSQSTDAARAIIECLAIRDALAEACREVQQAMQEVRGQLGGLELEIPGESERQATPGPIAITNDADHDLELAVGQNSVGPIPQHGV